ncbi:MAG: type II secretion system F family protein [Pseudomonadota bacterium]
MIIKAITILQTQAPTQPAQQPASPPNPVNDGSTGVQGAAEQAQSGAMNFVGKLWTSLESTYGVAGPFYAIAAFGMLLALMAVPFLLKRQKDPLERFSFKEGLRDSELVGLRTNVDDGNLRGLAPLLEPNTEEEISQTKMELKSAGYKSGSAIRVYFFARAAFGIGLLGIGLIFTLLIPKEPNLVVSVVLSVLLGLAGYFLPVYWVKRQIQTRRQEIQNAFPDAMDMMLVCIEGGQSLDQAMARVGDEMEASGTPLAEELQIVSQEFRAGKDRSTVLRDFADRCAVNDISSFVTVLIQSTTFGTSISQALRVYASEMRDKRLMRAEEKANVLPTKLTLGTMAFTVPPLILILVGPSFIQILRSIAGLSGG